MRGCKKPRSAGLCLSNVRRCCCTGAFPAAWLMAAALATAFVCGPALAQIAQTETPAPGVALKLAEPWSNVFGDRELVLHVTVEAPTPTSAQVYWRFATGAATLQRGERAVEVAAQQPAKVKIRLAVPATRDDVVTDCLLTVVLQAPGATETLASIEQPIHIFPTSPFAARQEWLKSLDIRLFDPEKHTGRVFDEAGIPFKAFANVDAIAGMNEGLLIVGEGVSFRDYRGLAKVLQEAAARGRPVLVLAPGGGAFPLPEAPRLALRGEDVIRELDKRLDAVSWPKDGTTRGSTLQLVGERGGVVNVEVADGKGWPWLETEYANNGRLVVCGFAIVKKWEATPTPRFLLARVLAYVMRSTK